MMNSLHKIVTVLAAIGLIGSAGASLQQASPQGVIVEYKEFTKLTNEFEETALACGKVRNQDLMHFS